MRLNKDHRSTRTTFHWHCRDGLLRDCWGGTSVLLNHGVLIAPKLGGSGGYCPSPWKFWVSVLHLIFSVLVLSEGFCCMFTQWPGLGPYVTLVIGRWPTTPPLPTAQLNPSWVAKVSSASLVAGSWGGDDVSCCNNMLLWLNLESVSGSCYHSNW